MARFVLFFGLFTTFGTLVFVYHMSADMIFCRSINKLVVCFFGSQFFHFSTAYLTDRMIDSMVDLFNRQAVHPVIISAFFLAFMLRNCNSFFRLFR